MPISPIFSGYLPLTNPGPFKNIGYTYIRSKPSTSYSVPYPKHTELGQPILNLEEVGYALFYPCDKSQGKGVVTWFPGNEIVKGYERFLGKKGFSWIFKALKLVVNRLVFPAHLNAPLLPSSTTYPLVLFSHGLAGTRTTYTQYAGALASQGYVVLVMEHRDGSAPAVHLPNGIDGKKRVLYYVKTEDLVWEEGNEKSLKEFRTAQLDFRVREIYEAYLSLGRVIKGDIGGIDLVDMDEKVREGWMEGIRSKVDISNVDLTGHSFGAGSILHLLHTPPPGSFSPIPVKRAIALDPWVEPIPTPTASTPTLPAEQIPPVLVINSPGFTEWDTHFDRLLDMTKKINGSFVSLLGSNHQSFSDFPLLAPTSPTPALVLLRTINDLSAKFLSGDLTSAKSLQGKEPDQGKWERGTDEKMAGGKGEVVVHLIGKQ